jgi:hypothetical protein
MPAKFISSDYDKVFTNSKNAIVINDIPYTTEADKELFGNYLITTHETDTLSSIPICTCGALKYGFNLGKMCLKCDTVVELPSESDINTFLWVRAPESIIGFIKPYVWVSIIKHLPRNGVVLNWIINKRYIPPLLIKAADKKKIQYLEQIDFKRGYNNLILQLDMFIDALPRIARNSNKSLDLQKTMFKIRHSLLSKYLPLPNRSLLVIENTPVGAYADRPVVDSITAVAKIAVKLEKGIRPLSEYQTEVRVIAILMHIADFTDFIWDTDTGIVASKKGLLRAHWASTRAHFSLRAVVSSIPFEHQYDHIYIPWSQAVVLFSLHIKNKLYKRGYSFIQVNQLINIGMVNYSPLLYEILKELIKEAKNLLKPILYEQLKKLNYSELEIDEHISKLGIPIIVQRNPSLHEGSAQLFYIPDIKIDLRDKTISISPLVIKASNGDFDGDEFNVTLLIGKELVKACMALQSHTNVFNKTRLGEVSHVVSLPEVAISILNNFIYHEKKHDKYLRLKK